MPTDAATALKEVEVADTRRIAATLSMDIATAAQYYDDDLVYTHSISKRDDKATFVNDMRTGALTYQTLQLTDLHCQAFGDVVMRTGRISAEVTLNGSGRRINSTFMDIWVRRETGWKMAGWQSTPIPA